MTAFSPSDLPGTVNTVEKLLIWSGSVLAELYPNLLVQSRYGELEPVVNILPVRLQYEENNPLRVALLSYVPLEPNWRNARLFLAAKELGTAPIPNAYRT